MIRLARWLVRKVRGSLCEAMDRKELSALSLAEIIWTVKGARGMIGGMIFFVFGTHPVLSLAEIAAVLGREKDYAKASPEILLLEKQDGWTLEQLQDRLAGVVKIGQIVGETSRVSETELADLIAAFIHTGRTKKISFGVSVYDGGNAKLTAALKRHQQKIGLEIKRRLKESGLPVRYVSSRAQALSAVIVTENDLLDSGGEFVLIATPEGVKVGQTETVQGYKAWSKRDYGRPARDAKAGMLPPKLARLMINLATPYPLHPENLSLLDPFCGSGTILMEAGLMGFQKIIGSDLSPKAVSDTVVNLHHVLDMTTPNVFASAAEDLPQHLQTPVDVIVTETYLGPPQAGKQNAADLFKTIEELKKMYAKSFPALAKILKPGGHAVIAFPAYVRGRELMHVVDRDEIKKWGFAILPPLAPSTPPALQRLTPTGGLLYRRPDAHVAREILVMKKI